MCTYNTYIEPFLDNKETVGSFYAEPEIGFIGDFSQVHPRELLNNTADGGKVARNRKRCFRMARGKKQADLFREDINFYLRENPDEVSPEQLEHLLDYRLALSSCCHYSLFREHKSNGAKEFIGAHTCKHKLCPICNAQRSKNMRRKFLQFFDKNPDLLHQYDFMHLTLTVPHSKEGGKYQGFYATDLMKTFNKMRKRAFWKRMVYAGEFSVEITRNDAGLHIHIHSLLLVHKSTQNRNELHKEILLHWNKLTDGAGSRQEFTEEEKAAILKSNKHLTNWEVDGMSPSGATFVGLESLYVSSKEQKPGYRYCPHSGLWKKYLSPKDGEFFMNGIMECLKYHFEPIALKKDGSLNVALVVEILPAIKGQPLYRKFGAFHSGTKNAHPDAKMLNINANKDAELEEDINEMLEEMGTEIENPETNEPAEREDYDYFMVTMSTVYLHPDNDYQITIADPRKKHYLEKSISPTTFHAIKHMAEVGAMGAWKNKKLSILKPKKTSSLCLRCNVSETLARMLLSVIGMKNRLSAFLSLTMKNTKTKMV